MFLRLLLCGLGGKRCLGISLEEGGGIGCWYLVDIEIIDCLGVSVQLFALQRSLQRKNVVQDRSRGGRGTRHAALR